MRLLFVLWGRLLNWCYARSRRAYIRRLGLPPRAGRSFRA